ncbi:disease resistance protein RGA2 [Trifolium repens]|nr:disease resistance protein RGA2 [Trifolium repens]
MAEQIPYAVAASLINRLGSAALRELGLIYGVMDELEKLKNKVECIRAVLLDAEEKQEAQNHSVQNWVRSNTKYSTITIFNWLPPSFHAKILAY